MKILHTADLHLGKRLERFERLPEQIQVMEEICQIAENEQVDAVVIAGDLFDNFNPSTEATELFYRTLRRLSNNGNRPVLAIAGNHDSPDRIEAPDPLARACGILLAGYPTSKIPLFELETGLAVTKSDEGFVEIRLPGNKPRLRVLLTPYANEARLRKSLDPENPSDSLRSALKAHWGKMADAYCDENGVNILLTHLFMMGQGQTQPEESEDERSILVGGAGIVFTDSIPPQIQYAALGHLHRYQNMPGGPCPVVYSSSPLAYSFAEADQQKSVTILELEPGKAVVHRPVVLKSGYPLLRRTFADADTAVDWLAENQDCYIELTLETDDFIHAQDRKRFSEAHPRLIGPIPKFRGGASKSGGNVPAVDLSKSREALFKEYFQEVKGIPANDTLMDLFREITSQDTQTAQP